MKEWTYESWMEPILDDYCGSNMKKLRKICKTFIDKMSIPEMNWDELYSDAQNVLMESLMTYDSSKDCSFNTFLVRNISNSIKEWVRNSMRAKRCNVVTDKGKIVLDENEDPILIQNVSLDYRFDDGLDVSEKIGNDFDLENTVILGLGFWSEPDWKKYLSMLSDTQKKIIYLISDDKNKDEIMNLLHLSSEDFSKNMNIIRAYENTKVLYNRNRRM